MADIQRVIDQMRTTGAIDRIARNRLAQFGTRAQRFLGAELLPAQDQNENAYTDDTVRYRTVVANAGTRYSPVVIKQGALVGTVKVELFDIDIGSELTSRDYDALVRYLNSNQTMEAIATATDFLNTTVNMSLEMTREMYRWQAIEKAVVTRKGANGYLEPINYSNPAGHRAAAAGAWSNDAVDPMTDILNRQALMATKGFQVNRIITTLNVIGIMGGNDLMRSRAGAVTVNVGGGLVVQGAAADQEAINRIFRNNGLPIPELYDAIFRTQTGTGRYISTDVMIFVGTTGRDVNFELGDSAASVELLPDTLGYYGVGRTTGQATPGRHIQMKFNDDDKPHIAAKGWETGAPVITEPEAICTISGIA